MRPTKKQDFVERSKSTSVCEDRDMKGRRNDRCLTFMEIDPGVKSLKKLDSQKMKNEIRKWAKAVVAYARQVSRRLSTRRSKSF